MICLIALANLGSSYDYAESFGGITAGSNTDPIHFYNNNNNNNNYDDNNNYNTEGQHQQHPTDVQLSKEGWRPMYNEPVSSQFNSNVASPQINSNVASSQINFNIANSQINSNVGSSQINSNSLPISNVANNNNDNDDFVNYDYGSLEDEASVVVRPYEVPSQVTIQQIKSRTELNLNRPQVITQRNIRNIVLYSLW